MKEAFWYEELSKKKVKCVLCPRKCVILEGKRGNCLVRKNKNGRLFSMVYGMPCAMEIDPVEKKPQYHFLPGTFSYSIGTAGCNLHCKFCQNWWMSQTGPESVPKYDLPPEEVVARAEENRCKSIAYTYNDPVIFSEYAMDTAKLAHKAGLKNIFVTNGFINQKPLGELCKFIDGFHVDLKGFTEEHYKSLCGAWLKPVLETLVTLKKKKKWFEIINLIVPTMNDDPITIQKMCNWIKENLGENSVIHFSRFFPDYKLINVAPTPLRTLEKAAKIAIDVGLKYIYIGNVFGREDSTFCLGCKNLLIRRTSFFQVLENHIKKGKCEFCETKIPGIWE